MGNEYALEGLPLRWDTPPESWSPEETGLRATAGPRTDLFVNPDGTTEVFNAPRLLGTPDGDFTLSARVDVEFAADFDAGVLLLHGDDRTWAKLCFEYSPQGEPMVVSVVTRGSSDDANSFVVAGHEVWMRIARVGAVYAFHASTDGKWWQFVRQFALPGAMRAGLAVQSPTGEGCTTTFRDVRYGAERLTDLRNGS